MQVKSKLWRKELSTRGARALSFEFCQHFDICYCEIYLVDRIEDAWGVYIHLHPPHILVDWNAINRIGIIVHELTHHLEYQDYDNEGNSHHGYAYQLAKQKVIRWAKSNISPTAPWHWPLKAHQIKKEQIAFKL